MEYPEATLLKGEIIVENYYYELSTNEKVVGEYYLDIGFGSIINNQQIEKCLCIVYIK